MSTTANPVLPAWIIHFPKIHIRLGITRRRDSFNTLKKVLIFGVVCLASQWVSFSKTPYGTYLYQWGIGEWHFLKALFNCRARTVEDLPAVSPAIFIRIQCNAMEQSKLAKPRWREGLVDSTIPTLQLLRKCHSGIGSSLLHPFPGNNSRWHQDGYRPVMFTSRVQPQQRNRRHIRGEERLGLLLRRGRI